MATTTPLYHPDGGVSDSATTTPDVVAVPTGRRGAYLTLDAPARVQVTATNSVLTPDATNMGYMPAGAGPMRLGTGDAFVQIAAVSGTVNYTIAWLV